MKSHTGLLLSFTLFLIACNEEPPPGFPKGFGSISVEIVEPVPAQFEPADGLDPLTAEQCSFSTTPQGNQLTMVGDQLTYAQLKQLLPELKEQGITLNLAIQAHKLYQYFLGDTAAMDEIAELIRAAEAGMIKPWLVLTWCDGYFPGSTNYPVYIDAAHKLDQWWRLEMGFEPNEFLVDMELRWSRARKVVSDDALVLAGAIQELVLDWQDPQQFAEANRAYAEMVDQLKSSGWRVKLSTNGILLDDYRDNDEGLLQAWGTPINHIDWDGVSWQIYRTLSQGVLPPGSPPLSGFMVSSYLRTAHRVMSRHFPDSALGVDLGLTHAGPIFPNKGAYSDTPAWKGVADEIAVDVEAALFQGIQPQHITVYNLKGVVDAGGVAKLRPVNGNGSFYLNDGVTWLLHLHQNLLDGLIPNL